MQVDYTNTIEIQDPDIKSFLPKSLLDDLDQADTVDSKSTSINSTTTSKLISPVESTDDLVSLSNSYSYSYQNPSREEPFTCNYITRTELFKAITFQKCTIVLQEKIKTFTPEQIDHTLNEISSALSELMRNRNGNYFCSDFFKWFTQSQTCLAITSIQNDFYTLATNEFSTHPLQVLIDQCARYESTSEILLSLLLHSKTLCSLASDINGAYVIQKVIHVFPENSRQQFNWDMWQCFISLSVNQYGICVIKKYIENITNPMLLNSICTLISDNFHLVSNNQYGNYLIQHMFDWYWQCPELLCIKCISFNNFSVWATQKFSSFWMDNFLSHLSKVECAHLLNTLEVNHSIKGLFIDKHGSFLMKK